MPAASYFAVQESLRTAPVGFKNRQKIISQYDEWHHASAILEFRNCEQRRLLAEAFNISAREAFRPACEFFVINVGRDWHALARDPHNVRALGGVRFRERDNVIEAPAPQKRRLDSLRAIRSCHQNHAFHVAQIIDFPEQLAENPLIHVAAKLLGSKFWRHRVNGVEK